VKLGVPRRRRVRLALLLPVVVGLGFLVWWRGPDWGLVGDAFTAVRWEWVAFAIGLNLVSVLVRAAAWQVVINQALPPPHPRFPLVFSAFSVGLFANAVLPGRVGELARVAVLSRKISAASGTWAALVGTVFAHRIFDLIPSVLLIIYVLLTAKIPDWAVTSLELVVAVGFGLLLFGIAMARRHHRSVLDELGPARRLVTMARHGLGVLHSRRAVFAACFQTLGWLCQLLAVYTAMRAFHIHAPLPAAALVLVLMNVATVFPLWPGNNIGLLQAAIALPLIGYGVAKAKGIAFGFGLQFIEASVGVGVGTIFLAREGLSFALLRRMPEPQESEAAEEETAAEADGARARARIPG
jgi:uncharacterized protein (TIRG00374 family)